MTVTIAAPLDLDDDIQELAKRVRAARAYAQLTVAQLADGIGLGAQTIKRIESGRRKARPYELWAIADACALPRAFFEVEFDRFIDQAELVSTVIGGIDQRLSRLEHRLGGPNHG